MPDDWIRAVDPEPFERRQQLDSALRTEALTQEIRDLTKELTDMTRTIRRLTWVVVGLTVAVTLLSVVTAFIAG